MIDFVNSFDYKQICNGCIYYDSKLSKPCSGAMFVVNGDYEIACMTKIKKETSDE